jgi:hypothetical protein
MVAVSFMVNESISGLSVELGLGERNTLLNYNNSHISQMDTGDYTLSDDFSNYFPETTQNTNVGEDSGNWFTDTFSTFKDWILSVTGISLILNLINSLPNLLKLVFIGNFNFLAYTIGYIWWVLFVISVIKFARGQD